MLSLTFLGTGTSNGIPIIGCHCDVCTSDDPRDTRSRTSALVKWDDTTLLIDTATELRLQALRNNIDSIDAVLYTHPHADHTGGLDDLRRFNELAKAHLPVFANPETTESLKERYGYAFVDHFPFYGGKPDLELTPVEDPFEFNSRTIIPIPVFHGKMRVFGYRFGPLAYVTDAKTIPEASFDLLSGVEYLVINALRERSHPTHLNLGEAVAASERIGPRKTWLVHLSHELSHEQANQQLPDNIEVAWDGLMIHAES